MWAKNFLYFYFFLFGYTLKILNARGNQKTKTLWGITQLGTHMALGNNIHLGSNYSKIELGREHCRVLATLVVLFKESNSKRNTKFVTCCYHIGWDLHLFT